MFGRGKAEAWEGVVTEKKRSSPDGQNMYHRVTVELPDGEHKDVRVRGAFWRSVEPGDRLVKRSGETDPVKE
ncbi:hypothetical protein Afil01_25710 [Actinorhabdospora filicis]|uniref:DUF7489 domain-containing protein n=1 Tax=Actinorhabdospora filicis TaxID=1785913 RepID=A0A9W6W8P0_9ACTN|nr:hypothetical protein [Actinorhabdospora filicis]GLZ77764.1 hypothetical protein Afil01_25710 [Actinorhabdospora filicis]